MKRENNLNREEGCQSQCGRIRATFAEQCGIQANGALCPNNLCCSQYGYCGSTPEYCEEGCQSQCERVKAERGGIEEVFSKSEFNEMLKHRDNALCPARGFYTYDAFVAAANSFPEFATTGDSTNRKREIAAFFAHTSHATSGGWNGAPDGPYAWGFCFFLEQSFPQNRKFGLARSHLDPTNAILSFQNALSFFMSVRPPKPSCHEVMSEQWTPSPADVEAGRLPGFGLTINIINGREECGHGEDSRVRNRIGFYKRFCDILEVSYGENLDCNNQIPFDLGRSMGNIFLQ